MILFMLLLWQIVILISLCIEQGKLSNIPVGKI